MSEVIQHQPNLPTVEAPLVTTPADLVRVALESGSGIDQVRELMNMQIDWEANEARKEYAKSMAAVQKAALPVHKGKWNPQTESWYVDISAIADAVNNLFADEGFYLSFYEGDSTKENHVRVMCDIGHADGHKETRHIDMPIVTTGIKGSTMMTLTHATGSAFTYGRRYLIVMLANLPTPDNDGNQQPMASRSIASPEENYSGPAADLLRDAANMDELKIAWQGLSAKERKDLNGLFGQRRKELR